MFIYNSITQYIDVSKLCKSKIERWENWFDVFLGNYPRQSIRWQKVIFTMENKKNKYTIKHGKPTLVSCNAQVRITQIFLEIQTGLSL